MTRLAGFVARAAGWLSRRTGRGGGTTLPGVVMLKLRPNAVAELGSDLKSSVVVSATNGKTTTTRLLAAAVRASGVDPVTNAAGSNLERGIAAALLDRKGGADVGVFEVDEAALTAVTNGLGPDVIVLMNLFRDQLDRYGELETLLDRWRELLDQVSALSDAPTLVLNADDPNIASLGEGRKNVVWFGVDDQRHAIPELAHAADATTCRHCGKTLVHDVVLLGHLGHWHCATGDATRPSPTVAATAVELSDTGQSITITYHGGTVRIETALPGLHNSYNAVAAFAAAQASAERSGNNFDAEATAAAIGATAAAFGRGEVITIDDSAIRLLLAKNPTGVNQNVRTVLAADGPLDVLVLLNDRTADGQDVSWIWDVDWENLAPRLRSLTLGGDRAYDLALRFRYGGFDMHHVHVHDTIAEALDGALDRLPAGATLQALPTYTAMLDLRAVLTDRGLTGAYWEEAT